MDKDRLGGSLRALATNDEVRSETARLKDVFDDIETALDAGVKVPAILETLHKLGFKMSLAGFRSAIQRIRKERAGKMRRRSTDKQPPVGSGTETEMGTPASNPPAGGELPPSPQNPNDETKPDQSLDEVLDSKQRDEKFDKYSSQNPLMKRKEKQK